MRDSLRIPSYRRHVSGQAVVTIRGRDFYLGKYGSVDSKSRYRRLISEYTATGRMPSDGATRADDRPTVSELMLPYLKHCDVYYRQPDGKVSNQAFMIRLALRTLRSLYSDLAAVEFGPLKLKVVRDAFVKQGLARTEVNRRTSLIKQFFEWAVSEELIPPDQIDALKCVRGLKAGRTTARETAPVELVSDAIVDQTLPYLPHVVAAMVELQRLTGMRPQEVTHIRTCDLDQSGEIWEFRPAHHKNQHRGKDRVVMIGPRARAILAPWVRPGAPESPLFSPQERMAELSTERRTARRSPLTPSQRARKPRVDRSRPPGSHYTPASYRRAIHRACYLAFPHPDLSCVPRSELTEEQFTELQRWQSEKRWSPNQLRHSAATRIRSNFGVDVAAVVLGHSQPDTTLIYAERDLERARDAMSRLG